jgi:hypothetical protein
VAPGVGNVEITRVRVFIRDGRPQAYVEGNLGDGCTRLLPITQQRVASGVNITLSSVREGEVCTMIMQLVNDWIPLAGIDAPGSYTVRANRASIAFQLIAGPDGQLRVDPDPGPPPSFGASAAPGFVAPDEEPTGLDGPCNVLHAGCASPGSAGTDRVESPRSALIEDTGAG